MPFLPDTAPPALPLRDFCIMAHTFSKAEKLKSRKRIELLFSEGKSFFAAPVKCYYRVEGLRNPKNEPDGTNAAPDKSVHPPTGRDRAIGNLVSPASKLQAGVSVSKRHFKHATDRNRIKRLMREAYRLHKYKLQEKLMDRQLTLEVFFVFTDRTIPTFALVEEKIKYCLRRLGKIVEEEA